MSSFRANKMVAVGVADVSNVSSPHRIPQSDMTEACNKKSTKDQHEDDVGARFDSGISSASNLSETDLAVETEESEAAIIEHPKIEFQITQQNSMRLDSGIDIDVSDQLVSNTPFSPTVEKSQTFRYDRVSHDFNTSRSTQRSTQKELWDLFFEQDEDGDTKLHIAIVDGQEEIVRKILLAIPDSHYLNLKNYYSQTALHLSVLCDQPNIVRLLLLAGANTGIEDANGNTALHLACLTSNLHCTNALLSPITVYEQKYIRFSFKPVIDSPSVYLNEYNYDGLTCVHIATKQQNIRMLGLLFQYGADVNMRECKSGYTILHEAVLHGNLALIKNILQHNGIDIEKKNYERLTPFQLSMEYPHISQFLLENGAIRIIEEEESDEEDYSGDDGDDEYYQRSADSVRVK